MCKCLEETLSQERSGNRRRSGGRELGPWLCSEGGRSHGGGGAQNGRVRRSQLFRGCRGFTGEEEAHGILSEHTS